MRQFIIAATVTLMLAETCLAQDKILHRFWTTANGTRSKIRLRVVDLNDSQVTLERKDNNKTVVMARAQLSESDQRYLRQLDGAIANGLQISATSTVASSASSKTTGWPRWRGPENDGISKETGLMDIWPAEGPPVLWSASGLGQGYSSVSIWGDKIYTLGDRQGETKLICLSTEGGRELWDIGLSGGKSPNSTPTVDPDGKLVFGLSHAGTLVCANAETGEEVWRKDFERDFGGSMMSMWGYSESPLVDGDRLICTPGSDQGVMVALDKRTGRLIWRTPMQGGRAGYSSPVISNGGGVKQYITLVGNGLIGVSARDGRLLWHYPRIANSTANVPTPIVKGDYVFCSSGYDDGGSALLRLGKNGAGVGFQEIYYLRSSQLQNHHGGMVLIGDHVFMGHGHNRGFPVCFNLKTGTPEWGPERGPGSGSAAITAADGKLYFRYENGKMALIDASTRGYRLISTFNIKSNNGKSWAHPVIVDKKLYLRDQHELHCYAIAK